MHQDWTSPEQARGELLLVDDSLSSLAFLSSMLSQSGYQVREAPSGELALMTLKVRIPELILLDVRMPGMDGFEVCRRIKAEAATREVPVIFLSAQNELTDRVQGLKVGAVDFIGKDFAQEEVLARIDTHITLARIKKMLDQERDHLEQRVRERTRELLRSQRLLLAVIDSGPDWIHATNHDKRYLLVNQHMAAALGYEDASKLIGQYDCEADSQLLPSTSDQKMTCKWNDDDHAVFSGKDVYHANERVTLPNHRELFFETYKTPLKDMNGDIYGLLCYRRDITQRLSMEHENHLLEKSLWQAKKMEAIGQLTGGIAHDFNHLLSLILGNVQFAQAALASGKTEKLDYYLGEVIKAGSEGQHVVAQLLSFSRKDELATEAVDAAAFVVEAVESLRQAVGTNISLRLDVASELPKVYLKAVQIKQAIVNLILNARDALGGQGRIDVRLFRDRIPASRNCASCGKAYQGDYLVLSVSDTGPGIPQEIIGKIFYPFFTTKDVGSGTGLGLPMVHGITHSAGGHIQLESGENSGTTFSLLIPLAVKH